MSDEEIKLWTSGSTRRLANRYESCDAYKYIYFCGYNLPIRLCTCIMFEYECLQFTLARS